MSPFLFLNVQLLVVRWPLFFLGTGIFPAQSGTLGSGFLHTIYHLYGCQKLSQESHSTRPYPKRGYGQEGHK